MLQTREEVIGIGRWLGVDVGGKRKGFDAAVVDEAGILDLWRRLTLADVVGLVETYQPVLVAIDSPRACAPTGETSRESERKLARSICGIRWTPDEAHARNKPYYAWIVEGLSLFDALSSRGIDVIEVFPTASWTRWYGKRETSTRAAWSKQAFGHLGLEGPTARNQDQRDAVAAAATARQHTREETRTIGEIVVPAGPWVAG